MPEILERPFIVIGAGGHGVVVIDLLRAMGCTVSGVVAPACAQGMPGPLGAALLGEDHEILKKDPGEFFLAMGIGSVGATDVRTRLFDKYIAANFVFPLLCHPRAVVSQYTDIASGSQVMAGAVVQANTRIGKNCIINTHASLDHDCTIEDGVHIAPGAVLSGGVHVGAGAHIGTGARIIQSITIGPKAVIGAGVTVLGDVPPGTTIRAWQTPVWHTEQTKK